MEFDLTVSRAPLSSLMGGYHRLTFQMRRALRRTCLERSHTGAEIHVYADVVSAMLLNDNFLCLFYNQQFHFLECSVEIRFNAI